MYTVYQKTKTIRMTSQMRWFFLD